MTWRIRKSSAGGYVAECGNYHAGGDPGPRGIGATMPAFIVYTAARFDSIQAAKKYAAANCGSGQKIETGA